MKIILISVLLFFELSSGFSIQKLKKHSPSTESQTEMYQVEEIDNNTIRLIYPKSEKPVVRDIVYYHVKETPYETDEEVEYDVPENDDAELITERDIGDYKVPVTPSTNETKVPRKLLFDEAKGKYVNINRKHNLDASTSKRKREVSFKGLPPAPTLSPLDLRRLPKYIRNLISTPISEPIIVPEKDEDTDFSEKNYKKEVQKKIEDIFDALKPKSNEDEDDDEDEYDNDDNDGDESENRDENNNEDESNNKDESNKKDETNNDVEVDDDEDDETYDYYDEDKITNHTSSNNKEITKGTDKIPRTYGMNLTMGRGYIWNDLFSDPGMPDMSFDVGEPDDSIDPNEEEDTEQTDKTTEKITTTTTKLPKVTEATTTETFAFNEPITNAPYSTESKPIHNPNPNAESNDNLNKNKDKDDDNKANDNANHDLDLDEVSVFIKAKQLPTDGNSKNEGDTNCDDKRKHGAKEDRDERNEVSNEKQTKFNPNYVNRRPEGKIRKPNNHDVFKELLNNEDFWQWLNDGMSTYMDKLTKQIEGLVHDEVSRRMKKLAKECKKAPPADVIDKYKDKEEEITKKDEKKLSTDETKERNAKKESDNNNKFHIDGKEIPLTHSTNFKDEKKKDEKELSTDETKERKAKKESDNNNKLHIDGKEIPLTHSTNFKDEKKLSTDETKERNAKKESNNNNKHHIDGKEIPLTHSTNFKDEKKKDEKKLSTDETKERNAKKESNNNNKHHIDGKEIPLTNSTNFNLSEFKDGKNYSKDVPNELNKNKNSTEHKNNRHQNAKGPAKGKNLNTDDNRLPVTILASNIFGNAVGSDKVTNIFIFNLSDEYDTEDDDDTPIISKIKTSIAKHADKDKVKIDIRNPKITGTKDKSPTTASKESIAKPNSDQPNKEDEKVKNNHESSTEPSTITQNKNIEKQQKPEEKEQGNKVPAKENNDNKEDSSKSVSQPNKESNKDVDSSNYSSNLKKDDENKVDTQAENEIVTSTEKSPENNSEVPTTESSDKNSQDKDPKEELTKATEPTVTESIAFNEPITNAPHLTEGKPFDNSNPNAESNNNLKRNLYKDETAEEPLKDQDELKKKNVIEKELDKALNAETEKLKKEGSLAEDSEKEEHKEVPSEKDSDKEEQVILQA